RLSEVEIHHVDLAAGYSPADWPEDFLLEALPRVAESFAGRDDAPSCLVWADSPPRREFRIGPVQAGPAPVRVHGEPTDLLAWLTGRGDGTTLTVVPAGPLPALPAWR
ncbi:MAG: maleylpyruvate isomerase, partial [Actinobacteria bacterium]|nr:maleylpyruvate isomerase [Actinomycetota bacterium]